MYRIADALVRLIAPVLVFTSEEVWKHLPRADFRIRKRAHRSLSRTVEELEGALDEGALEELGQPAQRVREEVLKALEQMRA